MEISAKYLQVTHMSRYNTLVRSVKFSRVFRVHRGPGCNCYSVLRQGRQLVKTQSLLAIDDNQV